jgi:hypothetical protein
MLSQPTIEEVDRGAFVAEGFTVEGTTMMVNDKAIARFAIEAFQTIDPVTVIRLLDDEAKINRDALIAHGGMTGIGETTVSTMQLGTSTDGTVVELGGDGDLGDTEGVSMKVRNTARVKVPEALMPENACLIAGKVTENVGGIIGVAKEKVLKGGSMGGGRHRRRGRRSRMAVTTDQGGRRGPRRDAGSMLRKGLKRDIKLGAKPLVPKKFLGQGCRRNRSGTRGRTRALPTSGRSLPATRRALPTSGEGGTGARSGRRRRGGRKALNMKTGGRARVVALGLGRRLEKRGCIEQTTDGKQRDALVA